MKIALWWNLVGGGAKRTLRDQVRFLVDRGHEIHAWSPATADLELYAPEGLASERFLPIGNLPPARRFRPMERHARMVGREIDAGGFDVVFAHSCRWFAAPHVSRFCRTPVVVHLHEPLRHLHESRPYPVWTAPSVRPWTERLANLAVRSRQRRLAEVEWTNAQAAKAFLVSSLFSRESVQRAYSRDARLCSIGVDTDYWCPGTEPRQPLVAGVGTVLPHKGLDVALRCMARLPEPRPRLEWIGNFTGDNYAQEMKDLAARLGIPLTLRMGVPQDDVRDLLRRASVFFFPARLEPMGYAPLEASACGCPVVGFREGGVRETVRHGETGLLGQSEEDLSALLGSIFADPQRSRRMGEVGREWVVGNWNIRTSFRELEDELEKAARRP